jgi:chromosome partitioning protein
MKTLVLANQKGGVGKSAVASLLTYYFLECGQRVLAIDLDHQGNFTRPITSSKRGVVAPYGAERLLLGSADALPKERFVIVPAGDGLLLLERKEGMHTPYARAFRAFLQHVDADFDVCVVDTHPSPDIRLISAIASADFVLSPMQLNQESLDGVRALLLHPRVGILKIKALLNQKLHFIGLLPTMTEATNQQRSVLRLLLDRHLNLMIRLNADNQLARIPKRTAIQEAQAEGLVLWEVKKQISRDAWTEIKPTIEHIASVVMTKDMVEVGHAL